MKKSLFIIVPILLMIGSLITPKRTLAVCYYIGNDGYGACAGGTSSHRCQSDSGAFYACCNEPADVCPAPITTPVGTQTPAPPNPDQNPSCGGTSQSCCSGGTCDSGLGLTCYNTAAGSRCMSQAQINQTSKGTPSPSASPIGVTCNNDTGIQTAIGCIPVLSGTNAFSAFILRWAVGIGGGIAFILGIYAGFMIMTSGGNPERLKAGQELLTSAISGLILLIFSVFVLKFIGIDILGLGQFGFGQ